MTLLNIPPRSHLAAALALVVATLSSGALAAPQAKAAAAVTIHNFAFRPAVLTVRKGTTVTWTNGDEDPHTIVATGKSFRSAALDSKGRYSFAFTRPGTYAYYCSLHPRMTGKIIVTGR